MSSKEHNLTKSKTFCMAPWVHTHIWPNGDVYPCCMAVSDQPLANYKAEQDLKSTWNTEKYKNLRLNMLSDTSSDECARCYEQETNNKHTLRKQLNREFAHCYNLVEETNLDGSLEILDIRYLDIRFSNICNLTCRTCGPDLSSSWGLESIAKNRPNAPSSALIRIESGSKNKEFWNDLSQYIENVERIYFAGGEPLLMQEHYNILDYLLERNKTNIKIYYNTNFSNLNFKQVSVLDYWQRFKNVVVCASLDGSYEKGELIRKGLDWNQVVENRKEMKLKCPDTRFVLAPTISVFNADHVLDFYDEWLSLGLVEKYNIQFNVLLFAEAYRIELLPKDLRNSIVERIESYIADAKNDIDYHIRPEIKTFVNDIEQFKNALLNELEAGRRQRALDDLNQRIASLDSDRNEDTYQMFPHLTRLKL